MCTMQQYGFDYGLIKKMCKDTLGENCISTCVNFDLLELLDKSNHFKCAFDLDFFVLVNFPC